MNTLDSATRATVVRCLVNGMSIRGTSRTTGASKGAILRLLEEVGGSAARYQDLRFRNLRTMRVEADEIWSFCGAKQREARVEGQGDLWTYCAIDAETKLVFSWLVGPRRQETTDAFIADISARVSGRIQLTTDGLSQYLVSIRKAAARG